MEKIEWWETLFSDVSAVEYRAINQAAHEINQLNVSADVNGDQIRKLFSLDRAQHDELERLRLTVRVLTEVLIERGLLTEALLSERMNAAVAAQEEAKRAAVEAAKTKSEMVRCLQCSAEVKRSKTNLSEWGLVCDSCYQRP